MKRYLVPVCVNLVVPGPGLILLGRPWLGVGLAAWFTMGAEMGVFGLLIGPATVPRAVVLMSVGLAGMAWVTGQVLLAGRIRFLQAADLPRELAILRRLAGRAMGRGDYRAARAAIAIALSLDESDVGIHVLRARLAGLTSSPARARRAWLAASRLDVQRQFADEIGAALQR